MREIRLLNMDEKADIKTILLALPDWFGLPDSLESYVVESQKLTVLGCFEETKLIGFYHLKANERENFRTVCARDFANLSSSGNWQHHDASGSGLCKDAWLLLSSGENIGT